MISRIDHHQTLTAETHRLVVPSTSPATPPETIVVDWLPISPDAPCAVFIHGLASDRQGDKALYFQEAFASRGWSFLKLDLRGHGESDGTLPELTISRALIDLETTLRWCSRQCTSQAPKPLLIGSSMGACLAAWHQIQGSAAVGGPLVLLAPALDFPHLLQRELSTKQWQDWQQTGLLQHPSSWADIRLGWQLIENARQYPFKRLLEQWKSPALLIHGLADESVPWEDSIRFLSQCPATSLQLLLVKSGDHRLSAHKEQIFHTIWQWLAHLPWPPKPKDGYSTDAGA